MNINIVTIGGNLTGDPEKREVSGTIVTEFSVAINERYKKENGDKVEKTHFIRCFSFGKTAENIATYFKKGQRIIIEGSLAQDTWTEKETEKKREKTRVRVSNFHFVEKSDGSKPQKQESAENESGGSESGEAPDDIPY